MRLGSARDKVLNVEEAMDRTIQVDDQCDGPTLLLGGLFPIRLGSLNFGPSESASLIGSNPFGL